MGPIQERYSLDFQWRGFELHPEIPVGGIELSKMFPRPQLDMMLDRLKSVAGEMNIEFDPPDHAPSTKKALAISEFARGEGKLDAFRTAAMDAYWRDGKNIEDDAVLAQLAESSGLDADHALAFLKDARVPALLEGQRDEAAAWGVTGIPTWFMLPTDWSPEEKPVEGEPHPVKVVGCQPLEVVERAAKMAGAALSVEVQ